MGSDKVCLYVHITLLACPPPRLEAKPRVTEENFHACDIKRIVFCCAEAQRMDSHVRLMRNESFKYETSFVLVKSDCCILMSLLQSFIATSS
ncbi:uncharacterized protein PHALS_04369 [Plasmopara halstedii]|uniref:Uncharacterized protein n=1 Tax=Plasmopara halstedii TaxID=4781 RepID=A0A0P1AYH1_PLAHL|nr:uncharacterized protein PHALS_04369 [Plasmopara halstedii]CEG47498.1 hypothetical protein PHALS_04369 [Plasmopara halstedii]|eukprot:XP_024583867.1 hypothetical protein PHALS_04369 [Plasmopara halstedii]